MKNDMNNQKEQTEEIPNIEQFQVSRSSFEEKDLEGEEKDGVDGDAGYTSEEVEFADGEGTQLDEEIPNETDEDNDLLDEDDLNDDDLEDDTYLEEDGDL